MGKIDSYGNLTVSGGDKLLASEEGATATTGNITVDGLEDFYKAERIANVPSTAGDTGTAGQIAIDTNYIYVCTATNTWKRVAIATW